MNTQLFLSSFLLFLIFTSTSFANIRIDGSGSDGYSGRSGSNGSWYGQSGSPGTSGHDGDNASPIIANLIEENNQLKVTGTIGSESFNHAITATGKYIVITTSGGDGGNGGNGGNGHSGLDGSSGRDGYDGRRGYRGRDGDDGTRYSPNGQNGTDGGRGYDGEEGDDGEDGGNGGHGASGGNSGDGGNAASIIVKYKDPSLLMHIAAYHSSGDAGMAGMAGSGGRRGYGGSGGDGGDGGYGGYGGNGGDGYTCTTDEHNNGCVNGSDGDDGSRGWSGRDGRDGTDGSDGYSGQNGQYGSNGSDGRSGSLTFVQIDNNGNTIGESSSIYNPFVKSFSIVDENEDGIFEPGEKIFFTNIIIKNNGEMDLPAGTILKLNVKNDIVTITLPQILKGSEYQISEELEITIDQNQHIGSRLNLSSTLEFRGLYFKNTNASEMIKVQWPIIIENIEYGKFIPFATAQFGKVVLKNISTKKHDNINLSYFNNGEFDFKVIKDVKTISAGQSIDEIFSITAASDLSAYQTNLINLTLSRDETNYQNGKIENQAIPSYIHNKTNEILIVSNGHNVDSYDAIVKTLSELKLSHEIYDINLNGELTTTIMNKYHGKAVIFTNMDNTFSSMIQNVFNSYLKTLGGVFTTDFRKTISPSSYQNRIENKNVDYFDLSLADQIDIIKTGVIKVLAFDKKLELMKKHFTTNIALYSIFKNAYIEDVRYEYLLYKDNSEIYAGNSFIKRYKNYTLLINAVTEYDFRIEMIDLLDSFLTFDESDEWDFGRFKKEFKQVKKFYDNKKKLQENCNDIRGVYMDKDGNIIQVYTYSLFGGLRAETEDLKFQFRKGKEIENKLWRFVYWIGEAEENEVKFNITCNAGKTTLIGNKSHGDRGDWNLTKIYFKRLWYGQNDDF